MKRLAILIASMICSYSVFGKTGPYIGIGLGYSEAAFNLGVTATSRTDIGTEAHPRDLRGKPRGVQGKLVAGYGYDIKKFNLAAELTAQFPEISHSKMVIQDAFNEDTYYYKFCYAFGIDLVPSYRITKHNFIYLKVGITRGRFGNKDIVNNDSPPAWDTSFYDTGFNFGVGDAIYLNKHLKMRLEYLYTNYQTHKFHNALDFYFPAPPAPVPKLHLDIDGKIHPIIHAVMLEIDYHV